MSSIYELTSEEFLNKSRLPMRVVESEQVMYEEIAQIMTDTILINNRNKKSTIFICPVGPIGHYPIFIRNVNEHNISLKNVWFFSMDEYLDNDGRMLSSRHPLSFVGFMQNNVYSKIRPELLMPEKQRIFPIPGREHEIDELLKEMGDADYCLTSVGINGHIAFNEPPELKDPITDKEYAELNTRSANISKETIVNNGSRKFFGALDIFPKRCITIGMKQILKAKKIKIYLYCDWHWGIMRKIALEAPSRFVPASFLQLHSDSEMVVTRELYNRKLF